MASNEGKPAVEPAAVVMEFKGLDNGSGETHHLRIPSDALAVILDRAGLPEQAALVRGEEWEDTFINRVKAKAKYSPSIGEGLLYIGGAYLGSVALLETGKLVAHSMGYDTDFRLGFGMKWKTRTQMLANGGTVRQLKSTSAVAAAR